MSGYFHHFVCLVRKGLSYLLTYLSNSIFWIRNGSRIRAMLLDTTAIDNLLNILLSFVTSTQHIFVGDFSRYYMYLL